MAVDTDDLRDAIPSLYPDNLNGEIDAARLRAGQNLIADVIDEAIGKTYSDEAKAWAQSPEGVHPDSSDSTSESSKTWALRAANDADQTAQNLSDVLAFTDTQMRSVSEFSSLGAFEAYRQAFDYWRSNSLLNVGNMTFQKRASDNGLIWVRVDQEADKLLNGYLQNVPGVVESKHLEAIPALSLLCNMLDREGRPMGLSYEEFLYAIGHRWYGDTANGGFNVPRSTSLPNAANATRSGRGTSVAGETTVTFQTPFAPCIPNVIITPKSTSVSDSALTWNLIGDPGPTNFKCVIKDSTGTPVIRGFNYFATGNGDY